MSSETSVAIRVDRVSKSFKTFGRLARLRDLLVPAPSTMSNENSASPNAFSCFRQSVVPGRTRHSVWNHGPERERQKHAAANYFRDYDAKRGLGDRKRQSSSSSRVGIGVQSRVHWHRKRLPQCQRSWAVEVGNR